MPTDLAAIAAVVLAALFAFAHDDVSRWSRWMRFKLRRLTWGKLIGERFARRRIVTPFAKRRFGRIRVPRPDEHSRGIMVSRRDINTGAWT